MCHEIKQGDGGMGMKSNIWQGKWCWSVFLISARRTLFIYCDSQTVGCSWKQNIQEHDAAVFGGCAHRSSQMHKTVTDGSGQLKDAERTLNYY